MYVYITHRVTITHTLYVYYHITTLTNYTCNIYFIRTPLTSSYFICILSRYQNHVTVHLEQETGEEGCYVNQNDWWRPPGDQVKNRSLQRTVTKTLKNQIKNASLYFKTSTFYLFFKQLPHKGKRDYWFYPSLLPVGGLAVRFPLIIFC